MSYIETERLILRTWMQTDAPALAAIYGDPETMQYILSGTRTVEETHDVIAKMVEANERDGCSMWPVVLKENSELIGTCGLMKTERERVLELGFAFAPAARGKGYAYEASRGVLHFGFDQLHAKSVIALTSPFNAASIVLINKLGMRFDRVVRMKRGDRGADVLRYECHG
jgi:ribosomal-protein-alanine N-acetyltransferase